MKHKRVRFWVVSTLVGASLLAVLMEVLDSPTVYAQQRQFRAAAVLIAPGGRTLAGPAMQRSQCGIPITVWGPSLASPVCATLQLHLNTEGPVELRVGDAQPVLIDPGAGSTSGSQCDADATQVIVECLSDLDQDCNYSWRVDMFW